MTDPETTPEDDEAVLGREIAEQGEIDASDRTPSEKAASRDEIRERADDDLGVTDKPDVAPS